MRTLVLIKPGNRKVVPRFLREARERGLRIVNFKTMKLTALQVGFLYPKRVGTKHWSEIKNHMISGRSWVFIVEGKDACDEVRKIKGKTGSGKGIRGDHATSFIYNVLHSSDEEDAEREIQILF